MFLLIFEIVVIFIIPTTFIFNIAHLLNSSMVMNMGNVFFVIQYIYFHAMVLLTFLNGKYKTTTVIVEFLSS